MSPRPKTASQMGSNRLFTLKSRIPFLSTCADIYIDDT